MESRRRRECRARRTWSSGMPISPDGRCMSMVNGPRSAVHTGRYGPSLSRKASTSWSSFIARILSSIAGRRVVLLGAVLTGLGLLGCLMLVFVDRRRDRNSGP